MTQKNLRTKQTGKHLSFAGLLFCLTFSCSYGQSKTGNGNSPAPTVVQHSMSAKTDFPKPKGLVNDFENDMDLGSIAALSKMVEAHKVKTTNQVAVVTVASFEPYKNLTDYGKALMNNWGLGEKGKGNGVIIIFSQKKNEVKIVPGAGLEQKLSQFVCEKVIMEKIFPKFRESNYDQGLIDATAEVIKLLETP